MGAVAAVTALVISLFGRGRYVGGCPQTITDVQPPVRRWLDLAVRRWRVRTTGTEQLEISERMPDGHPSFIHMPDLGYDPEKKENKP